MSRTIRIALAALTLGAFVAACDRPTAPEPARPAPAARSELLGLLGGVQLLSCPATTSDSASAVVGPAGGALTVGGFRVDFPAGAVDTTRTFVLTVPASRYLEIEVHAEGFAHYEFAAPVTVTLDVSRCGLLPPGLQVWHIDSETKTLLEPLGSVVDLLGRKVRFQTSHFSGYSIAW